MNYICTQLMAQINGAKNTISHMPASDDRKALIEVFLRHADELRMIKDAEIHTNTRLNYLYRDAGNWKCAQYAILPGVMTDDVFQELVSCCEDGQGLFIPEQVGLPLIRDWETTEDDHPYCELEDFELVNDGLTTGMTIGELLERFRKAKGNWRPEDYAPEVEDEEE